MSAPTIGNKRIETQPSELRYQGQSIPDFRSGTENKRVPLMNSYVTHRSDGNKVNSFSTGFNFTNERVPVGNSKIDLKPKRLSFEPKRPKINYDRFGISKRKPSQPLKPSLISSQPSNQALEVDPTQHVNSSSTIPTNKTIPISTNSAAQSTIGTSISNPSSQPRNLSVNPYNDNQPIDFRRICSSHIELTANQIASRHTMNRKLPHFYGEPTKWQIFESAFVPITPYENAVPKMIIGLNYSKLMVSFHTIEGDWNQPIVCRTRLGWVVQGPNDKEISLTRTNKISLNMCECQLSDKSLHQLVKEFFSLESFGVKISDRVAGSKELIRAHDILESSTIKKGNSYETGLLWRKDGITLPNREFPTTSMILSTRATFAS